jgi:hypothetical protein
MNVVFECEHCRKNLMADETASGATAPCPACERPVIIPPLAVFQEAPTKRVLLDPPPEETRDAHTVAVATHPKPPTPPAKATSPGSKTRTIKVPTELTRPAPPPPPQPVERPEHLDIVVGWICIAVGTLLAILMPRAVFVYIPFFLGSLVMTFVLVSRRKILHALVLVICTGIPPPLLMREDIWRNVTPPAGAAVPAAAGPRKLVFDAEGTPQVVSAAEQAPSAKQPPNNLWSPTPPPPFPNRPLEAPKPAEAAAAVEPAEIPQVPPPPAGVKEAPKDPYEDLVENAEEIPPLVPEDVLAATVMGHGPDFRWQERSVLDSLSPGDPAPVVDVPFGVYSDGGLKETYSATGRLGNKDALQFDEGWDLDPHSGDTCIYVRYEDDDDWVTVAWQHPGHNWGDCAGGFDLSKANELTFWAKGEAGTEKVEFMVGMEQAQNAVSRDSLQASTGILRLHKDWTKHSIPLAKLDRSRLITGFLFRIEGQGKPVVFRLDDIQFE